MSEGHVGGTEREKYITTVVGSGGALTVMSALVYVAASLYGGHSLTNDAALMPASFFAMTVFFLLLAPRADNEHE